MTSDLAKRRRRANLSLRGLQHAWIPLSVTYLAWLSISGYELAGWGGALMMCLVNKNVDLASARWRLVGPEKRRTEAICGLLR